MEATEAEEDPFASDMGYGGNSSSLLAGAFDTTRAKGMPSALSNFDQAAGWSAASSHASTSSASYSAPYNAWEPLREALPHVSDGPQSRTSSYYPIRHPSQDMLHQHAYDGLEEPMTLLRSRPPSRTQTASPRPFVSAIASGKFGEQGTTAQPLPDPSLFAAADPPMITSTAARAAALPAQDLNTLLAGVQAQRDGAMLPPGSRQATYGAYPSQWDFIAQPDSYASETQPPYTPSYDSLSLAADDGDPLFALRERFPWRSHSEIGSEDALSLLHTGVTCTPAMSDYDGSDAETGGMPLFAQPSDIEGPMQQGSRSDTVRMSAERAGLGLDAERHDGQSALMGEVLAESPPAELDDEGNVDEEVAQSPSMKPFSINGSTSPFERGGSLSKLEIPAEAQRDVNMSAASGEETAHPATARPNGPPTAEVEKLLQQLTSQGQSQIPTFAFAPATPADALAAGGHFFAPGFAPLAHRHGITPEAGRPPNRQRSLSNNDVPPSWSGIDPRMLGSEGVYDGSAVEDEDFEGHESSIGPRRRSAASSHASPYLGAQQLREQHFRANSEEPIYNMRRTASHNFGHRRNAQSEDLSAPIAVHGHEFVPDFLENHAVVPSFDGPGYVDYGGNFVPMPVPSMSHDLSAVPRHIRSLSRASSTSSPHSLSDAYSETGGEIIEDPVHWDSQTTVATKQAAAARRKPGSEAKFICEYCGETFTRAYNLKGHLRAHNGEKPFVCSEPGCGKAFARAHDRSRHENLHTNVAKYRCNGCGRAFKRLDALQRHHKSDAGQNCVAKLISDGELPPFPTAIRQAVLL